MTENPGTVPSGTQGLASVVTDRQMPTIKTAVFKAASGIVSMTDCKSAIFSGFGRRLYQSGGLGISIP